MYGLSNRASEPEGGVSRDHRRETCHQRRAVVIVAAYLSDFSTREQWDPHTESCRQLQAGPVKEGSTFENVQRLGSMRLRYLYTVQSFEPGRVICLVAESRSFVATDTMTFHSTDVHGRHEWTDVTYTVSLQLKGAARLSGPLLARLMDRLADEGAAGMRTTLARLAAGKL